ncbi:MAG: hypothetical protein ACI4TD_07995 [Phocaeicola sp.]
MALEIELAKNRILIYNKYGMLERMCNNYSVPINVDNVDFTIQIADEDIEHERKQQVGEMNYSDAYLETLAAYRHIAEILLPKGIILVHGSTFALDGVGYLFMAPSGTGKSTHTKLWREAFGERIVMVNDDKPLLEVCEDGVIAYGTPWDGKHHLSNNIAVPLKAICILERGDTNFIHSITPREAFPTLLQQSYRPSDAKKMLDTLKLVRQLSQTIGLFHLSCNMEPDAAKIAYQGMNGGEI